MTHYFRDKLPSIDAFGEPRDDEEFIEKYYEAETKDNLLNSLQETIEFISNIVLPKYKLDDPVSLSGTGVLNRAMSTVRRVKREV